MKKASQRALFSLMYCPAASKSGLQSILKDLEKEAHGSSSYRSRLEEETG